MFLLKISYFSGQFLQSLEFLNATAGAYTDSYCDTPGGGHYTEGITLTLWVKLHEFPAILLTYYPNFHQTPQPLSLHVDENGTIYWSLAGDEIR